MSTKNPDFIKWFADTRIEDIPLVGGKNASLGEMYRALTPKGVKVPNGFAVTAEGYRHFIREAGLDKRIREILASLDTRDMRNLHQRGSQVRHAILGAELPEDLQMAILKAYARLRGRANEPPDVAVRSSATAEDLPDASFAGQQETYLNVQGDVALLETCKRCFTSLFTDRAISYRVDRDSEIVAPIFDERNAAVKKMIADVIGVCRKLKRKIGICGQAPSDYPEFAQFLVEQGIDSISLNPDTVMKTTVAILKKEKRLGRG